MCAQTIVSTISCHKCGIWESRTRTMWEQHKLKTAAAKNYLCHYHCPKSHSLSSSAFALSTFVSLLPQLLPQLLHHSALPPLPVTSLAFLQSMQTGSQLNSRITLGQLLSPRIMATPALVTSTCARQGSRQKGIGSQERPQVVSPNGGSIRALIQKPRQIDGGKSETKKADAKSCRS